MNLKVLALLSVFTLIFSGLGIYNLTLFEDTGGFYATLIVENYDGETGELKQREVVKDDLILKNCAYALSTLAIAYDIQPWDAVISSEMTTIFGASVGVYEYDTYFAYWTDHNDRDGMALAYGGIHIGTGSNSPLISDWYLQTFKQRGSVDSVSYSSQGNVMNVTLEKTFVINGTYNLRECGYSQAILTSSTIASHFLFFRDVFPAIAVVPTDVFTVRYVLTFNEGA
jgi:hypothetical protein